MTQASIQYACSPTIGDYGPITAENLAEMHVFLSNTFNQSSGVIYWTDATRVPRISTTLVSNLTNPVPGLLAPTQAGGIVSIDTGVALVNGYLYFNDTAVAFDINANPGNVNATDIIALRWTAATQAVRLVRLNGAVGTIATLTQSSTTWEVPIARVLLDGSGQFSTLTDVRRLITNAPGGVGIARQGGSASAWLSAGTTNFRLQGAFIQCGVIQTNGITGQATVTFPIAYSDPPFVFVSCSISSQPVGFVSNATTTQVVVEQTVGGGDIQWMAIGNLF